MPLTTMDPKPALLVIDLQEGFAGAANSPLRDIVAKAATLAAAFRRHQLPVVLVTVTGTPPGRTEAVRDLPPGQARPAGWAEPAEALNPQPADHRVIKQRWGAFHDTGLHAHLRALGVTQVVVTGVATSLGVESTARSAHEHGYNVVLAVDAMTGPDPESHRHSVERIFPRLGETATTAEILEMLEKTRPV